MAKRFFVSQLLKSTDQTIFLDKEETHHLRHVMRLKMGASCFIFDSEGNECAGKISAFSDDGRTQIYLKGFVQASYSSPVDLIVAQAIPQRAKMDKIVEKSAELGIGQLIPIVTDRTIVRIKKTELPNVRERWMRILHAGEKQSGSRMPVRVLPPQSFEDVLNEAGKADLSFIFHPAARGTVGHMRERIHALIVEKKKVRLMALIGPEGGFTEDEYETALAGGVIPVWLESNILKSDTAFVTAVSLLQFGWT